MVSSIYWIKEFQGSQLGTMARPRGGEWLEDDVLSWKQAGVQAVASALTYEEMRELDIQQEEAVCLNHGILFFQFPIQDRGLPISFKSWDAFISNLTEQLEEKKIIVTHCRMGIGRASLLAASLMVRQGISPHKAFQWIENARGCPVPDTKEQRDWLERYAQIQSTSK